MTGPRKPRKPLVRRTRLAARTPMQRGTKPIKKVNPARKAKRVANNRKFYASAQWKATRIATFRNDGWRCTATVMVPNVADDGRSVITDRCPNWDETRTGKGLVCDELRYTRRGRERIGIDTRTLCRSCNQRETVMHRANHANGFNNGLRR